MSIEAMKQAVEAFEHIKKYVTDDGAMPENWDAYHEKEYFALEALRQAIEQAEKEATLQEMSDIGQEIEPWDTSDMAHRSGGLSVEQEKLCKYCRGIGRVVCDGRCMPEQEPVTWAETNDLVCALLRQAHDVLACASYPFKRPWVSLTDEEIDAAKDVAPPNLGGEYYREDVEKIARAIAAKIKEKNGG